MDSIRASRNLQKELKKEYGFSNSWALAEALYNNGIFEVSNEIRTKISYLMGVCSDFSFDNYWIVVAISSLRKDEIEERYKKYSHMMNAEQLPSNSLALSLQLFSDYEKHFVALGFNEQQLKRTLTEIIKLGAVAKTSEKMKEATRAIEKLGMEKDELNQFICDNVSLIYNDYSRRISEKVSAVFESLGKEEAIKLLKEHPEVIRYGFV